MLDSTIYFFKYSFCVVKNVKENGGEKLKEKKEERKLLKKKKKKLL
jgi:hypothetical protein